MSNPLAGQGASPKGAEAAQAAIEEGRRIGAEDRTRARLHRGRRRLLRGLRDPLRERSRRSRVPKAYEALAQRYPDDDEAQIFSALYTAGTQTQADQTYAAYLKAAAILENAVREVPRPSGRRALPDPQLRRAADRRRRAWSPRAATPASRRRRRTRCTCLRTSSRASAPGRNRPPPTCARCEVAKAGNEPDEAYHAADYMVYAYLQLAPRRRGAPHHRRSDEGTRHQRALRRALRASPRCRRAMRSSAAHWQEAAQLQPLGQHLSRSSRRSPTSRAASARRAAATSRRRDKDAEQLADAAQGAARPRRTAYWATEVEVQRLAAAGWIALGRRQSRTRR